MSVASIAHLPTVVGEVFLHIFQYQLTTVTLIEKSRLGIKHWG